MEKISEYFNENKQVGPTRQHTTLKNHLYCMIPMVNEFNQAYNKISSEHRSVWNDEQVKDCACKIFNQNHKKQFIHGHVWLMLKNDPK